MRKSNTIFKLSWISTLLVVCACLESKSSSKNILLWEKKRVEICFFDSCADNNLNTRTTFIIIQHIDTLPKYGKKLSMYVGSYDVYPTVNVNCSILTRECKNKKLLDNIFSSNFVLLSMC